MFDEIQRQRSEAVLGAMQHAAENIQAVMRRVYLWMAAGLLLTALAAYGTIQSGFMETLIAKPGLIWLAFGVELLLVFGLSAGINRMSVGTAAGVFLLYSAVNGLTMALIVSAYTTGSVAAAFVTTAALFGTMSVIGATTKVDLTKYSTIFMMALIGLVIAMVVNIFLGSSTLDLVISIAGVIIFTALTAYDTQRITQMAGYYALQGANLENSDVVNRLSIRGALTLYLDFINLFIFLLRLFGGRRR